MLLSFPSLLFAERAYNQTLVRLGAYQSLGLTISEALKQRSPDFPGVVICTVSDSLGTLLQLIKKRRVHRLVVVEGEVCCP
jgi:5'-AMP-activated protein kinase regulatory gamma subunit